MTTAEEAPGRRGRRASATRTRLWGWLLVPPALWMLVFFVSSLVIVVLLSFGHVGTGGRALFGLSLDNYRSLWNETYLTVFIRSLLYAGLTVVCCLLIGYPVAYTIALHGGRYKNALVAALVIPFFASYLIRMYAWSTLLSDEGLVNQLLLKVGLAHGIKFLNTPGAVIAGLTYGFVIFMILPIYASLERMDLSLIEAGKDLYHSPLQTFFAVTLPATRAGVLGGVLLVFLPALGDFVSAQLLGGPGTYMIGNLIQQQFFEGQNQPLGSALTVVLMAALVVFMVFYLRSSQSARRET
ncbi:MAG TPA: ABC transporter permease [Candidatus Nanopelagicales bacterium]|nr:ABC transporter permease [Candidatus Nanopelagicales bacterium]